MKCTIDCAPILKDQKIKKTYQTFTPEYNNKLFLNQYFSRQNTKLQHNFTLFSREKEWNLKCFHSFRELKSEFIFLSLISRMKSEMKIPWDRDREWKVKWKCLEIEIEKWNFKQILENSRETRLSQVTGRCKQWDRFESGPICATTTSHCYYAW